MAECQDSKCPDDKRWVSPVIVLGDANTHHFFAIGPDRTMPDRDESGRVRVYTDRDKCMVAATAKIGKNDGLIVAGMADAKWLLFQDEIPHILVD